MSLRIRVPLIPATAYAIVRPSSDVSDGLWTTQAGGTALSSVLDETVRDDTDYARSDTATFNDTFEVHLSDPASTFQNGTLKIVIGKETNNSDVVDFFVELRQGTTVIASWAYGDVAYGAVMKTERLTDAQFAAITDITDLRVRVTAGRFWTPNLIGSTMLARYRADTWTGTSSGIDDWTDLGPNGLTLVHTTSPSKPTLTGGPNGKPALDFNATYVDNDPIVATSNNLSAFIVTSMGSATVNFARLISVSSAPTTNDFDNTSSAALFCREGSTQAITSYRVADKGPLAIPAYDQFFLGSVVYNGTNCTLGVNGTYSTPSASTGAFGIGYLRIGATMTVASEYWRGKVCEVILTSGALATGDDKRLEGYLAYYYGISLAASHPYKNRPPFVGD